MARALIALAVTDFVPFVIAECPAAGTAWISVTSSVNAHAQRLVPNWTRARAAFMNITFQGGQAIGSVLLGTLAGAMSVEAAFETAGVLEVAGATACGRSGVVADQADDRRSRATRVVEVGPRVAPTGAQMQQRGARRPAMRP